MGVYREGQAIRVYWGWEYVNKMRMTVINNDGEGQVIRVMGNGSK